MFNIYFSYHQEAEKFYTDCKRISSHTAIDYPPRSSGQESLFVVRVLKKQFPRFVMRELLTNLFIGNRISHEVDLILCNEFHFHRKIERQKIKRRVIEIFQTKALIYDELNRVIHPYTLLHQQLNESFLDQPVIYMDHLFLFHKQKIIKILGKIICLLLDDYKSEEQHQLFIDTLRKYLERKPAVFEELHIIYKSEPLLFTQKGKQLDKELLYRYIQRDPLIASYNLKKDTLLTALIAINPKKIHLYNSEELDDYLMYSLIHIFEEKIYLPSFERKIFEIEELSRDT